MPENWVKTPGGSEYNEGGVACSAKWCELSLSLYRKRTGRVHVQSFLSKNARKNTMQELAEIVTEM